VENYTRLVDWLKFYRKLKLFGSSWYVDGLWIVGGSWCGWLVDCGSVWYVDSVCCGYCSTELKVV